MHAYDCGLFCSCTISRLILDDHHCFKLVYMGVFILRTFKKGQDMASVLESIRDTGMGLGIAIILPLMVFWGVRVFVETPHYPTDYYDVSLDKELEKARNNLEKNPASAELQEAVRIVEEKAEQSHKASRDRFSKEHAVGDKYHFYANIAVGLTALIVGGLVPVLSLSLGLIMGGIFCVIGAYAWVWSTIDPAFRFFSLLAALLVLIAMGYFMARRKRE